MMINKLQEWMSSLPGSQCGFYQTTGLYCPGCGGTRALFQLLRGDIIGSLKYNPIVLFLFLSISIFLFLWLVKKWEELRLLQYSIGAGITGTVILIVRVIILNYYVIAKGIHLV